MSYFIQRLPIDIVRRIIPYTYQIQEKTLLNDITHFIEIKLQLQELYHNYWTIEMQSPDASEYIFWLINDIVRYANNYNPTMNGYVDKFYNIFKRHISLQTEDQIDQYMSKLDETDNVPTQINVFIGLLTIQEREELLIKLNR
jgi:hypothetical protein